MEPQAPVLSPWKDATGRRQCSSVIFYSDRGRNIKRRAERRNWSDEKRKKYNDKDALGMKKYRRSGGYLDRIDEMKEKIARSNKKRKRPSRSKSNLGE